MIEIAHYCHVACLSEEILANNKLTNNSITFLIFGNKAFFHDFSRIINRVTELIQEV